MKKKFEYFEAVGEKVVQSRSIVAIMNAKQFLASSSKSRRCGKFTASRTMAARPSFRSGSIYFLIRCFAKLIALRCPSYCRVDEQKALFDVYSMQG